MFRKKMVCKYRKIYQKRMIFLKKIIMRRRIMKIQMKNNNYKGQKNIMMINWKIMIKNIINKKKTKIQIYKRIKKVICRSRAQI